MSRSCKISANSPSSWKHCLISTRRLRLPNTRAVSARTNDLKFKLKIQCIQSTKEITENSIYNLSLLLVAACFYLQKKIHVKKGDFDLVDAKSFSIFCKLLFDEPMDKMKDCSKLQEWAARCFHTLIDLMRKPRDAMVACKFQAMCPQYFHTELKMYPLPDWCLH